MEKVFDEFIELPSSRQLSLLEQLLEVSQPEVKYRFHLRVNDITKYDVISDLPLEIVEKILVYLDLNSLLQCRLVSRLWNNKVNVSILAWIPQLMKYCIDVNGFTNEDVLRVRSVSRTTLLSNNSLEEDRSLSVIGERMFGFFNSNNRNSQCEDVISVGSNSNNYIGFYNANQFIMGRKLLFSLQNQVHFQHIIDHDSRGSNVVMVMDEEILAYACEDRHIVVKYADFPHKKIIVFEAHQCADMKIHGQILVTGGYDRTICLWDWNSGSRIHCFEGSVKPVYSLDIMKSLIVSSDGRSVITWDYEKRMMLRKTTCFDDGRIEELLLIDPGTSDCLKSIYGDLLLVTRTSKEMKVWAVTENEGQVSLHSTLEFGKEMNNLQPFLKVYKDTVACSSEHGVLVWSLIDFSLIRNVERTLCDSCIASKRSGFSRTSNCRVILLYYSESFLLQYAVHQNIFQLAGTRENSPVLINWKYPSSEKWPWSHRKPGMATLVLNLEKGVSMSTKISMFVGTQEKRIYCMFFDASDLDYTAEPAICL